MWRRHLLGWPGLGVVSLVGLTLSCEGAAESLAEQRRPQAAGAATAVQPSNGPVVTLEFEPPPEFYAPETARGHLIKWFRVGYFRASPDDGRKSGEPQPLRTVDFKRDAIQMTGNLARISFTAEAMPPGDTEVVFRVQALTSGVPGFWSEPSAMMKLPERSRETAPTRGRGTPSARRSRPPLHTEVPKHPALLKALRALSDTSGGEPLDSEKSVMYQAFDRVPNLAIAVVICRDAAVACPELARRMIGPPRQPLRLALRQWKDEKAIPALIRKARSESRLLLSKTAP